MFRQTRIIVTVVIAVLLVIVLVQNTGGVTTRLLFADVTMPLAILLLVVFLLGLAVGLLRAGSLGRRGRKGK